MVAGVLVMQGARASADMVLTSFLVSELKELIFFRYVYIYTISAKSKNK